MLSIDVVEKVNFFHTGGCCFLLGVGDFEVGENGVDYSASGLASERELIVANVAAC